MYALADKVWLRFQGARIYRCKRSRCDKSVLRRSLNWDVSLNRGSGRPLAGGETDVYISTLNVPSGVTTDRFVQLTSRLLIERGKTFRTTDSGAQFRNNTVGFADRFLSPDENETLAYVNQRLKVSIRCATTVLKGMPTWR